jgi:toxin HigB-1
MLKSFNCKETEKIWQGEMSRKLPRDMQDRALPKLRRLDAALTTDDLKYPHSNHLEGLKGNRKGQMSIRITKQWRLCFIWRNGEAFEVEIINYH